MVEMFKLGGVDVTKEEVLKILTKSKENDNDDEYDEEDLAENEDHIRCDNVMLESFLNGFITFNRGQQDPKPGQPQRPEMSIKSHGSVNNVVLKKLKIALALTSEEIQDILEEAGVTITKSELGALLRKEGHKNYKECGDKYARNFLKGLAIRYRS
ncbi:DUF1456 family protein [Metabacillus litoralis]|uniref:DUF1456 family protein n=1 Tax=Metabacillus litoralis TaxID=152268 RepID=UPI0039B0B01F